MVCLKAQGFTGTEMDFGSIRENSNKDVFMVLEPFMIQMGARFCMKDCLEKEEHSSMLFKKGTWGDTYRTAA